MEENDNKADRFLSDEVKWGVIISIKYFELKYVDIAKMFGIASIGTVSKIYNKYLI